MKDSVKYLISTIIFFVVYLILQLIFMKEIDFKITFVATIIYGVINTLCHVFFNKKIVNK